MKKKLLIIPLAVFLLLGFLGFAHATIIDFEDLGVAANTQLNSASGVGVISQGFNYTPGPNNASGFNDLHISSETVRSYNGTTVGITHDDVILTKVGGGIFSLSSFDFAGYPINSEMPFSVVGTYQGGGSINANFSPDGLVDGIGQNIDFQTFVLGAGWNNLVSVTWNHTGSETIQGLFALDNINASPVPEPATMLLLGTGLVGVAGAARRRKKNQA